MELSMKRHYIIATIIILLISVSLFSQQGRGRIRGVVSDEESGEPLPDVTVKMYNESLDTYFQPSPVTDKEGRWSANFLRNGSWKLTFEKVGYAPQEVSYRVAYAPGVLQDVLTVQLRKIRGLVVQESIAAKAKQADKLFDEKKYDEAIEILKKIIADTPDAYILYKNVGNCYFAAENYEKALEAYMKVYEKQPDRADILADIANTYNNMGKKDIAEEWYIKIPLDQIRSIDTAYNTGVLLYNAGKPEEAAKYFRRAVEIDKEFADGYYQLGMASVASNKPEEAIDALKKFLALAPDSPQAATAKSILEVLEKK
jgi:tetratricopeptide (TPR) repeat protein